MALHLNDALRKKKPNMAELQSYVIPHAAEKWEELGIAMNFDEDGDKVEDIKQTSDSNASCCRAVLRHWIKGNGDGPVNWEQLILLLRKAITEEVVKGIESELGLKLHGSFSEKQEARPLDSSGTSEASPSHTRGTGNDSTEVKLPDRVHFSLPDGIEVRKYQQELAEPGLNGCNYIIYAPTGTGKTLVSGIIIKEHLNQKWHKGAKVLFMVDTNPLAKQQKEQLEKMIIPARVECQTGDSSGDISLVVPHADIIVCTAGKFQNDLRAGKVCISDFSLMIIDECHNVRKNSPQANMMIQYLQEKKEGSTTLPQVVGLTASPGAGDSSVPDQEKTLEHLIHLCALMDASSGIKVVEENLEELDSYTTKSTSKLMRIPGRNIKANKFIGIIDSKIIEWELKAKVNSPHSHTSVKYQMIFSSDADSLNPVMILSTTALFACLSFLSA